MKFSSLPRPLIFLLFTYTVLAAPTTRNDPFRTIALKQPKPGQDPICCLIPPPLAEPQPTEDELLLSFEDWKAKLLAEERSSSATGSPISADSARHTFRTDPMQAVDGSGNSGNEDGGAEGKDDRTDPSSTPHSNNPVPSISGQTVPQDQLDFGFGEPMSPHFRVPVTDRFNYASMECSARIHKAHKSAKSASSILSSKKDRYMLSPCAAKTADGKEENHFVVVELCEDIRIDTVQLANFEFFSGVFKGFTVGVAKTYTPDVPEWTTMGTYKARNIRGVQSFHAPTSLRDFYRYIRIDFHSHYGSEFYCPVSLLRVYGLTHLEEWKQDSMTDHYEQPQIPAHPPPPKANAEPISSTPADAVVETIFTTHTPDPSVEPSPEARRPRTDTQPSGDTVAPIPESTPTLQDTRPETSSSPPVNAEPVPITATNPPQCSPSIVSHSASDLPQSTSVPTQHTTEVTSSATTRSPPPPPSQATPVISLGSQALIPPPQASASGGESIYRTIMNRIAMVELNATLHARYVEEHTVGVRELLKRLTEEVGRLEGIGKAQAQMYQRSLLEMERHRRRLELEHGELMARVQYLDEEITMEKRLGVAQLCIMVAVLVFMALTRGTRGESMDHALLPRLSRLDRATSLSGEWTRRTRVGSIPTLPTRPLESGIVRKKAALDDEKTKPPSNVALTLDRPERTQHRNQNGTQTVSNLSKKNSSRTRTPQTRTPRVVRVSTPPTPLLFPSIVRANSHGNNGTSQTLSSSVTGPASKSVKRWARTAHVHEIKRRSMDSGVSSQSEAEIETPNDSSSRAGWLNKGKQKETEAISNTPFTLDEKFSRRGSIGGSPLRTTSLVNVQVFDTEVTDSWVDTDDASSSETDVYLNRRKERLTKSTDTLTTHHHPSPGLVGVGAS